MRIRSWVGVRCPRHREKTTGKLFLVVGRGVRVCDGCASVLRKKDFTLRRVR